MGFSMKTPVREGFRMSSKEQERGKGESRFWVNFTPDALKKFLHGEKKKETALFRDILRHSRDYQDALGLKDEDMELLEKKQGRMGIMPTPEDFLRGAVMRMRMDKKEFGLVAKLTCCAPYQESAKDPSWQRLIMVVSSDTTLNRNEGHGTILLMGVEESWHERIVETIRKSGEKDDLSGELFGFLKS